MERFDRPVLGEDDSRLRLEAFGLCGTDIEKSHGGMVLRYPVIPGPEPVVVIEVVGALGCRRRGSRGVPVRF
ncbi:MAG: alcohol dehydrogenase catalytic domain-containing protein [bacterium]